MKTLSTTEQLQVLSGRLVGLSATIRYELCDELRSELKELADLASSIQLPEASQ